ncbi:MAG TPA: hypothetical protein PL033_13645 [Candidatus Brocadiia bacterium]|nr:hypothetical protein [Candidatus Brocadiia bacterium]
MKRAITLTVVVSALMYACVIGTTFDPKVRITFVKAFGDAPLGIPCAVFVPVFFSLLMIPFPVMMWHMSLIMISAMRDGVRLGQIGLLIYLVMVGRRHPELRRSQMIVIAGSAWFIGLMFAWIAFAASKGI